MKYHIVSNKAGFEFEDPGFSFSGRAVLDCLFSLSAARRESLLFGISRTCLPLQKTLRWALGGSFVVKAQFTEGPLVSHTFECWSSEKYFMLGSRFEDEVQRLLTSLVSYGDVVYDVGSHIGYMAILFSVIVGETGAVFSFEPSPRNFRRLKRNIELNPDSNITLTQAAVSDAEGTAWLQEDSSQSTLLASASSKDESKVRTLRLDDFVFRDGYPAPTFLKIDVEGHAGPCLRGMRRILEEKRPRMILEIHHSHEAEQVSGLLGEYDYGSVTIDVSDQFPRRIVAKPRRI
jgi:FkbM family methyltransferase